MLKKPWRELYVETSESKCINSRQEYTFQGLDEYSNLIYGDLQNWSWKALFKSAFRVEPRNVNWCKSDLPICGSQSSHKIQISANISISSEYYHTASVSIMWQELEFNEYIHWIYVYMYICIYVKDAHFGQPKLATKRAHTVKMESVNSLSSFSSWPISNRSAVCWQKVVLHILFCIMPILHRRHILHILHHRADLAPGSVHRCRFSELFLIFVQWNLIIYS